MIRKEGKNVIKKVTPDSDDNGGKWSRLRKEGKDRYVKERVYQCEKSKNNHSNDEKGREVSITSKGDLTSYGSINSK
jgi:hypothetical protein